MTKGRLHRQWNFSLEGGWFPLRWRMGRIFKKQEEGRNTDKRTIMSNFKKWNRWACKLQDSGEGNGLVIRNNWLLRENGRERGFVSLIQSLTSLLLLRFIEDTNWEENKIISISQNVSHLNQDKLLPDLKTKASKFLLEDQGLRPYVPAVFSTLRLQFTALYWTNIGSYKETWPQMNHFFLSASFVLPFYPRHLFIISTRTLKVNQSPQQRWHLRPDRVLYLHSSLRILILLL